MFKTTQRSGSLSVKLIRIGTFLLALALLSIGLTLWVTWKLEGGAAAVNEAGRMRMQTWRMTSEIQAHVAPDLRGAHIEEFDQTLAVLESGNPTRPLFVPWNARVEERFQEVKALWNTQKAKRLLLRPCEVLSGIANPAILEVGHHSFGAFVQHRHMFVGRLA